MQRLHHKFISDKQIDGLFYSMFHGSKHYFLKEDIFSHQIAMTSIDMAAIVNSKKLEQLLLIPGIILTFISIMHQVS